MKAALHPNGFAIRLLHTFRNGMRLRLHTWPRGVPRLASPHYYRSWFLSIPLWGVFRETRYLKSARPSAMACDVLRCHATTGNGTPQTTAEGVGRIRPIAQYVRVPFLPYFCPAGAIHSFVPEPGFAASLVLFGPPKQVPRVWIPLETQETP